MHRNMRFAFICKDLPDDLVGAGEHRGGYGKAERFRGLQVDHKLEFGRLVDWQIVRLGALEKAAGLDASRL